MKLPCRQFLAGMAAAVAVFSLTLSGHGAWSQATRTIKIIVPFPPGGATDILARLLAEQIGRAQGLTTVVENRPGAGSVIGTEVASRAAPDGNTVLINSVSFLVNAQVRKLNYDPVTSFEPICQLVSFPNVIVVNSASPYRTLADLLNAARGKPGDLTLASLGPASIGHVAVEALKRAAGVDMIFVPYPGTAPAVNALLGDHVTAYFGNYTDVVEHIKAGGLRILATASLERIEQLPNIPTVAESGYRDYEADGWFGLFTPAKTSKETVSQLAGWFNTAMRVPEVKAKLVTLGLFPVGICEADFAVRIRKQYDHFGRVIREANIKAE